MKTINQVYVSNFGFVDIVEQPDEDGCFFDLFDESGGCLNEGEPFWTKPTAEDVIKYITDNYLTISNKPVKS